jgi:hypothetical protein
VNGTLVPVGAVSVVAHTFAIETMEALFTVNHQQTGPLGCSAKGSRLDTGARTKSTTVKVRGRTRPGFASSPKNRKSVDSCEAQASGDSCDLAALGVTLELRLRSVTSCGFFPRLFVPRTLNQRHFCDLVSVRIRGPRLAFAKGGARLTYTRQMP